MNEHPLQSLLDMYSGVTTSYACKIVFYGHSQLERATLLSLGQASTKKCRLKNSTRGLERNAKRTTHHAIVYFP